MAVDSFHQGCQAILHGPYVTDAIQKRLKPVIPDIALAAYDDLDAFMEQYNGQWFGTDEELDKRMGHYSLDIEEEVDERELLPDQDGLRERDWRVRW
jgi:hypothetical protein